MQVPVFLESLPVQPKKEETNQQFNQSAGLSTELEGNQVKLAATVMLNDNGVTQSVNLNHINHLVISCSDDPSNN